MKKLLVIVLIGVSVMCLCAGCGKKEETPSGIPISTSGPTMVWKTVEEAENFVGFTFDLPSTIGRKYKQAEIRTMSRQMIEVDYCKDETVVCVTKQRGNVKNIFMATGGTNNSEAEHIAESVMVFNTYEPDGIKIYIENAEYMWTVLAPKGLAEEEYKAFVDEIRK